MKPEMIEQLIEEIKELDYLENVIFISFSLKNMISLRNLLPEHTLQYLTSVYNEEVHQALRDYKLDWDVNYKALTKELIEQMHAEGIKVNCWTVDEKEDAERLVDWGVDFITTNILE